MEIRLIKNLKNYQKFVIAIGCFISIYSLYFFLENKIYLIGSDAFYYLSIGDSILQNGEIRNISSIPSQAVKTPQNGIAFVHVILSLIGLSAKGKVLFIVIINYLLYLSGVYPLWLIARWSGLRTGLPLVALLSVYLGAWHIYRINLLAINDGIFNSLTLWLVYLVINLVRNEDEIESISFSKLNINKMFIIFLFVIVLIQFRLNAALVISSALISSIAIRDYRASVFLMTVCTLLLISFSSIYLFVEVIRLENVGENYFVPMFKAVSVSNLKLQLWKILPRLVAGLSGLTNPIGTLFFTIFPLSMMYYCIRGITERSFDKVFISVICLSGLWFTMTFQNARFIWYIFPFIYIILLRVRKLRFIGYAFCLLVFYQSFQQFYSGFLRGPSSKYLLYLYENKITLPKEDSLLIAANGRHLYYFFNKGSYDTTPDSENNIIIPKELSWDLIENGSSLCISGDTPYIRSVHSQIRDMGIENGFGIQTKSLTPDLYEFEGWGLVELTFNKD